MINRCKQRIVCSRVCCSRRAYYRHASCLREARNGNQIEGVGATHQHGSYRGRPSVCAFYLAAYGFPLRVPSEALPLEIGTSTSAMRALSPGCHSCLARCGETMVLRLARRKKKSHGTVLTRSCWCSKSTMTCRAHAIGQLIDLMPSRFKAFGGLSAEAVRCSLRVSVHELGLGGSQNYNTHDFRRGRARDLAESKESTLEQVFEIGQWKSSAVFNYVDQNELETRAVVEAHICESE